MKHKPILLLLACVSSLMLLACSTPAPSPTPKTTSPASVAISSTPSASAPRTSISVAPAVTTTTTSKPAAAGVSFAGKTITLVVPASAGGATDIAARVYAKFLPRFLPGNPSVIVRDMPGGASTLGPNYVYTSKPDGLTLLAPSIGVNVAQLLGASAVKYDLLNMTTLMGTPSGTFYYMRTGIISKVEDLPKAKGLIFGAGSGSSPEVVLFLVDKELLRIPTDKTLFGYGGTGESRRALISGEINISGETTTSYQAAVAAYVEKGEIMLLFQNGLLDEKGDLVKDGGLPPIPTTKELYEKLNGKAPSGVAWDAYKTVVAGGSNYARTLLLPPGTPEGIARVYWDACAGMLKDTEFRTAIDALIGKGATWGVGEAYDKQFKANFAIKPDLRNWLRDTLKKYGVVVE